MCPSASVGTKKSCMTLRALCLGNYGTTAYEGHAPASVPTVPSKQSPRVSAKKKTTLLDTLVPRHCKTLPFSKGLLGNSVCNRGGGLGLPDSHYLRSREIR